MLTLRILIVSFIVPTMRSLLSFLIGLEQPEFYFSYNITLYKLLLLNIVKLLRIVFVIISHIYWSGIELLKTSLSNWIRNPQNTIKLDGSLLFSNPGQYARN